MTGSKAWSKQRLAAGDMVTHNDLFPMCFKLCDCGCKQLCAVPEATSQWRILMQDTEFGGMPDSGWLVVEIV